MSGCRPHRSRDRVDEELDRACHAELGLVFVEHCQAADKGGSQPAGFFRSVWRGDDGIEVADGFHVGEMLFEIVVKGEVEEDGQGKDLGHGGIRRLGEAEQGWDCSFCLYNQCPVLRTHLGQGSQGSESSFSGFMAVGSSLGEIPSDFLCCN